MNTRALNRSIAFIDSWLNYQTRQQRLPGISIALYANDEVVFSRAYGKSHWQTGVPLSRDHLFNVGSIAKLLTGWAVLQLGNTGAVHLDEKVVQYLPWLAEHHDRRLRNITIRQLMRHETGLTRDGTRADFWQFKEPFPDETTLRQLVLESDYRPYEDAMLKYSNLGYALLGQVIEVVDGRSYTDYVTTKLLQPYELTTIQPYRPDLSPRVAAGHLARINGEYIPLSMAVPTNAYTATSGWYATAADMCRLLAARFHQETLPRGERQHWRPAEFRDAMTYAHGYMKYTCGDRKLVGHSGSFVGHASYAFMDVEANMAVVAFGNSKDVPIDYIGEGIWGILDFFAQYGQEQVPPTREPLNCRLMNAWQTIDVVAMKDIVVCVDPDSWAPFEFYVEELLPLSDTEFIIKDAAGMALRDEKVIFHLDDTAKKLKWVNYAGATTLQENDYIRQLQ